MPHENILPLQNIVYTHEDDMFPNLNYINIL